MDKMKNYDFLNSPLMTPEEIQFYSIRTGSG